MFFSADIFKPFREALSDFEITDVYFSTVLPQIDIPKETDLIIINTGIRTLDGLQEINDLAYLKVNNSKEGQGINVLGIDHDFEVEPNSKMYEAIKTYLSNENVVLADKVNLKKIKEKSDNDVEEGFNWGYKNYLDNNL